MKVLPSLDDVDCPIDMVEVFRHPEDLMGVTKEAIAVGAKVLWGQIGAVNYDAAKLAEEAGLKVGMDRCAKIELFRPFWKPKLHLMDRSVAHPCCCPGSIALDWSLGTILDKIWPIEK